MKFDPERTYTLEEVEEATGYKAIVRPESDNIQRSYSVVDVLGDHSQYDFAGSPDSLSLVMVDGQMVEKSNVDLLAGYNNLSFLTCPGAVFIGSGGSDVAARLALAELSPDRTLFSSPLFVSPECRSGKPLMPRKPDQIEE